MKPIRLDIKKLTLVPTKRALVHPYRNDWKRVFVLQPWESREFFEKIKFDSQFAYWLRKNFGVGRYHVLAFQKGHRGFFSFIKIQCFEDRYLRLPRPQTIEQKENLDLMRDKRRLTRQSMKSEDELGEEQKKLISDNLEEVNDMLSLNKDISELDSTKHGPNPYLKSILPVYKEHFYSDRGVGYEGEIIESKQEAYNIW